MPNIENLQVGDELPTLTKGPVTRQMLVEWCGAENDYNTIHYSEEDARANGVPGTPIQGSYRLALLGRMIERWMGSEAKLQRVSASYRGWDLAGDTITCRGKVVRVSPGDGVVELDLWVENQRAEISTIGKAVVMLPG